MNIEYETHYCPTADITYIMKATYSKRTSEIESLEVIGFYCGEPNEEDTKFYIEHPSTKAEF